jgi:5-methylcytosine-specific restriction endonuclease McrA
MSNHTEIDNLVSKLKWINKYHYCKDTPSLEENYLIGYYANRIHDISLEIYGKKHYRQIIRDNIVFSANKFYSFKSHYLKNKFIMTKFGGECFHCRSCWDLTRDHYFPRSMGGSNDITNIILLCRSCNSKKNDNHPEKFFSEAQIKDLKENYGINTDWDKHEPLI